MLINFANDHAKDYECQVFIALSGDSKSIKENLQSILKEIEDYGKPGQGVSLRGGSVTNVKTPVWNGRNY